MPLDSEYELMQRLSAGNEDAFGELFGRYYPRVCAFVGCIVKEESTAEDIAQDIFLKIWERRDIFQGRVASNIRRRCSGIRQTTSRMKSSFSRE